MIFASIMPLSLEGYLFMEAAGSLSQGADIALHQLSKYA